MESSGFAGVHIALFFIRLIIVAFVVERAETLNRSKGAWGVFAFFLPIVALISIKLAKPHVDWHEAAPAEEPKG
jgi:hypothetical protein